MDFEPLANNRATDAMGSSDNIFLIMILSEDQQGV